LICQIEEKVQTELQSRENEIGSEGQVHWFTL
jgi:hypothetical protein